MMDLYPKGGLTSSVIVPPYTDGRLACASCTLLERDYTLKLSHTAGLRHSLRQDQNWQIGFQLFY